MDTRTQAHDEAAMARAIELAGRSRLETSPRPWVGAWIEPGGFAGRTRGRDGPHAEVDALRAAGPAAAGATLYCTLEPCCHHGRTGPCTDAIIEAGVSRVVVAVEDPDPKVAGKGLAQLRAAGIEVETGVGADAVRAQLAAYLTHRATGRPYVVLKLAATLDGRTAAADGTSQWITGTEARTDAHRLRAESQAVVVGAGTVVADDPSLTTRLVDGPDPRRIVLGRAPAGARVHPCTEWTEADGDLGALLDRLGADGVLQVLVEGGAGVAGSFHRAGLVDRYVLYLAPALAGGDDAHGLFRGVGASSVGDLWRGEIAAVSLLGPDLRVELHPTVEGAVA